MEPTPSSHKYYYHRPVDKHPPGVYFKAMDPHYESVKKLAKKRINIIKGQLDGLQKMIDNDVYCVDLLNQSLAIQNSLRSLDSIIFERHLTTHVTHQFIHEKKKAIKELVYLFGRINRKL